jgi:anti-anti-sigma factor
MLGTCQAVGDIGFATTPALSADLHDAIDASDEALVSVDCSDMTFIDSAGYHVLVEASDYAVRRGRSLMIRNLSSSCARVVRLCDWDHELRVGP